MGNKQERLMALQKKLKQKTRNFIESKHMLSGITIASFLESTIVPIPLEAVMVPLMQAQREKLWLIALMATLGCVVGHYLAMPLVIIYLMLLAIG